MFHHHKSKIAGSVQYIACQKIYDFIFLLSTLHSIWYKILFSLHDSFYLKEVNENLNFDEIILEACQRIAAATGALVKAAGTAQRELVDSGRVRRRPTAASDDGQVSTILLLIHAKCL